MKISMLPSIAFLTAALAVGGSGISTDAFARGGHGGGGHFHGAGGFGSAGGFSAGNAPTVLPTPLMPNTPLGRDVDGLNFNNQMRNGATGALPQRMRSQPGTELGTMKPSFETQLDKMNTQPPGTVTLP